MLVILFQIGQWCLNFAPYQVFLEQISYYLTYFICFQKFLNKASPLAVPRSTALVTNSILTYDGESSYLCNLCGRACCKKPSDHSNAHSRLTQYSHLNNYHVFNNQNYNDTCFKAITRYKSMTQTEDITAEFTKTDKLLHDLYLYNSHFFYVGYSVMGTDVQYASRPLNNCK